MSRATGNTSFRFTLPRRAILRGHGVFRAIIGRRRTVRQDRITCFFDISTIPPFFSRVGFVVKGAPNAVHRNRGKRLMREAYRLQQEPIVQACRDRERSLQCVFMLYADKTHPLPSFTSTFDSIGICLSKIRTELAHAPFPATARDSVSPSGV